MNEELAEVLKSMAAAMQAQNERIKQLEGVVQLQKSRLDNLDSIIGDQQRQLRILGQHVGLGPDILEGEDLLS